MHKKETTISFMKGGIRTMTNKITKVEMFTKIMNLDSVKADAGMAAFIQHEIDLLNRKSTNKKITKNQEANLDIMATIETVLAMVDKPVTITELQTFDSTLANFSNQKISALIRKMIQTNKVAKIIDKKKSTFVLVKEE